MVQANFLVYCSVALEIDFDRSSDLLLTLLGTTVASTPFWFVVSFWDKKYLCVTYRDKEIWGFSFLSYVQGNVFWFLFVARIVQSIVIRSHEICLFIFFV